MSQGIRILFVEDVPADAELELRELCGAGLIFDAVHRVETRKEFLEALASFHPDLILSDYALPSFDGMTALALARQNLGSVPFILCTGSVNEETAVACMKAGADDYILKEHISRLPNAVNSVLERVRLQRTVSETNEKLNAFFASDAVGMALGRGDGRITKANDAFLRMVGYDSCDVETGHLDWGKITPTEFLRQDGERIAEARAKGSCTPYRKQLRRSDGSLLWVLVGFTLVGETREESATFILDITESFRSEQSLRESEERYRELVESLNDVAFSLNAMGIITYLSPTVETSVGYRPSELIGKHFLKLVCKDDIPLMADAFLKRMAGHSGPFEFRVIAKDGSIRWVRSSGHAASKGKKVGGISGILCDITERKRADIALDRAHRTQVTLDSLLRLSLEEMSLDAMLQRALEHMLSGSWLEMSDKGAIFLVEEGVLALKAHRNLSQTLLTACATVPFGRCLCGRAASTSELIFASRVDERHETAYEGMAPHGHYCVPILWAGEVKGVLCLYVKEGHGQQPWDRETLESAASVLASMIQHRQAERALNESEARLRDLAFSVADWVWEVDQNGVYTYSSEKSYDYFGKSVVGMTPFDLMPADEAKRVAAIFSEIAANKAPIKDLENWNIRKDGEMICLLTNGVPILDAQGNLKGYRGADKDITERKRAQEALSASEERFRGLFENALLGLYRTTPEGQILMANAALCRMLGYGSFEDLRQVNLEEGGFAPDYPRSRFKREIEAKGTVEGLESAWRRTDGSTITLRESARAVRDAAGKTLYYEGTIEDISEQRKAEHERMLLSAALEQTLDAVVILDHRARVLYLNPAFEALANRPRAELLGARVTNSMVVKDKAVYREIRRTLWGGRPWTGEVVVLWGGKSQITLHASFSSMPRQHGAPHLAVGILQDITVEIELQNDLENARRNQDFARVASGVAHEVRNPLFAISTVVAALDRTAGDDPKFKPFIGHINDHVQRLSRLMDDLLSLGRPLDRSRFLPCDLAEVIASAVDHIEAATPGSRTRFDLSLAVRPARVEGEVGRLGQAVLNLLSNAMAFSPLEVPIVVSLHSEGGWHYIAVSNEGPAISEEMMPRLFEPFVSFRKGGTGLGLALVRQIVTAHGGTAKAENHPDGNGVSFTLQFPAAE